MCSIYFLLTKLHTLMYKNAIETSSTVDDKLKTNKTSVLKLFI